MTFEEERNKFELNVLHKDVPYAEYAAEPGLRASDLHVFRRSPAHWHVYKNTPEKTTDALQFGTLFHLAIERPEWFRDTYVIRPKVDKRTNVGKERLARWEQDNAVKILHGAPVVDEVDVPLLTGMVNACLKHSLVGNLIKNGVREVSLWATDPETGLLLQGRVDYLSERGVMVDFKTTRDASPGFFMAEIFAHWKSDRFYVLSGAHYAHLAAVSRACRSDSYTFVAIESEPPHGIVIYPLDVGQLDMGERWRGKLTRQFAECKRDDRWPGYPEEAVKVEVPKYAEYPTEWGEL